MNNNNAYIRVKLAQLEAQEATLLAELDRISERHKAYSEQLVAEDPATDDETTPED